MAGAPPAPRWTCIIQLSKNGDGGPLVARRRQWWWPVATLRDDACCHRVKGGADLGPPTPGNPLWPLLCHDNTVALAG
jgi:hypothetical protein